MQATRVLITEIYFDRTALTPRPGVEPPGFPGVAFAWFKGEHSKELRYDEMDGFVPQGEGHVSMFLDASLYEIWPAYRDVEPRDVEPLRNMEILEFLFNQEIVIEHSPPTTIPLRYIAASTATMGSFIGYQAAGGDIPLMFITVPAGVIVMGAAVGVANGLKNGLQRAVERLLARSAPRRRPRRATSATKPARRQTS